jgi:putative heme-binding domain-containing protein
MVAKDPAASLQKLQQLNAAPSAESAELIRKSMRRICDSGNPANLDLALQYLEQFGPGQDNLLLAALDGLVEGQKAKAIVPTRNVSGLLSKLADNKNIQVVAKAQQLGAIWGDPTSLERSLKVVQDEQANPELRILAIQSLKQQKNDAVRQAFSAILRPATAEPVLLEAIKAVSELGGDQVPAALLGEWKNYSPAVRRSIAEVLTSRRQWARELLSAVEKRQIQPGELPTPVVRSLLQSKDEELRNLAVSTIGKFRESNSDKLALIAQKKAVVLNGPVDLRAGREVAQRTCFICHKLYGEGAEIGPDLTGVGRSSLEALLANVIDPNQIIGKGYENVEIETKDGRNLSGRIVEESDTRVKLLSMGPKEEVIARSEIASLKVTEMSLMPEGLEQMSDAEFRNMIWYILNPPEDQKPVEIVQSDKALSVKARLPGKKEPVELMRYVMDPNLRPYLHPVRDASGKVVLTQDRPSDHVWQHGIFTGLHDVNGVDFWTEKTGKQRFVKLLDITQEQDRVGWRGLSEWVAPDGKVLLEEEQTITVYAPMNDQEYTIDFEWVLRTRDQKVRIGRHDYGGLAVRMDYDPKRQHLNSNGDRGQDTAEKRASWCSVSREFGGSIYGITVFDHPQNFGFPSKWRVDAQGLINPSPSLQGDWVIEEKNRRSFKYRLLVHRGAPDAAKLGQAFQQFSPARTTSVAPVTDGESIALWNPEWRVYCPETDVAPRKLPTHLGRKNVLVTHPFEAKIPASIERTYKVSADEPILSFAVAAQEKGAWKLVVSVEGEQLLQKLVYEGKQWTPVQVDLSRYAGKMVRVRLENHSHEGTAPFGYWSDLKLQSRAVAVSR